MAVQEILSRLRGTREALFRIANIQWKDSSGVAQARNTDDTAFADVAGKQLRIQGNNASNAVVLNAPNALGATTTYTLPATDGSTGDYLSTNGSGTLSWAAGEANANKVQHELFDESDTTITLFANPPDNVHLLTARILVEVAAGGGSPTLEIGTASDPDAYTAAADVDLKGAFLYIVELEEVLGTGPDDIIITIADSGQTFNGSVSLLYAVPA